LLSTQSAEAGRGGGFHGGGHIGGSFHGGGGGFHVSGGFHVGGGARWGGGVRWARPAYRPWNVGGHIYVGSGGYYPRYRYYRPYYYENYVPSYYGAAYYPVEPAPSVQGTYAVAPRPSLPSFGIGLFGGGVQVQDVKDSSDYGLLARLRLGQSGLFVEGELGKTTYQDNVRVDRRLGASLIYEIGTENRFAPYVLAGLGVQQADVADSYTTDQSFAEIGVGLRYAITPNFHIAADVRAGSRQTVSDDSADMPVTGTVARSVAPPTSDSDESEDYTRARLSAILYF
jgi:hypothetical protein